MDPLRIEPIQSNVSYLRARDPSLLAGLLQPNFNPCKLAELMEETEMPTDSEATNKQDENHINVYLRIKKSAEASKLYEIKDNVLECNLPTSCQTSKNVRLGDHIIRKYTFSHIFPAETEQTHIFSHVVKRQLLKVMNGENASLLTYGTSGSGKTYTIMGTENYPGIIPRSLEYIFKTLPRLSNKPTVKPSNSGLGGKILSEIDAEREVEARNRLRCNSQSERLNHIDTYKKMQARISKDEIAILDDYNTTLNVWISFAEIYNENIHDLLVGDLKQKNRPTLKLGNNKRHTYIKNLNCVHVTSGLDAYEILQYGLNHLNYAATSVNEHSSRSHCIFTIKIVQSASRKNSETVKVSYINFCDLAGSERSKHTMNVGVRLRESNNINSSLLVLGRCISIIRDSQKQNKNRLVPFRESKLTQLLQQALSGKEALAMIVTINPVLAMIDETMHVMNFSAIARDIVVEYSVVEKPKKINRFSEFLQGRSTTFRAADSKLIEEHEHEVEKLKGTIEELYNIILLNKEEAEEILDNVRKGVVEDVKRVLKEADEKCEARLEAKIDEYEEKIEKLKSEYQPHDPKRRKLNEDNSLNGSQDIICLDDSDDEIDSQDNENHLLLKNDLLEAHIENDSLKEQLVIANSSLKVLREKYIELEQKYLEAEKAWDLKTQLDAAPDES